MLSIPFSSKPSGSLSSAQLGVGVRVGLLVGGMVGVRVVGPAVVGRRVAVTGGPVGVKVVGPEVVGGVGKALVGAGVGAQMQQASLAVMFLYA